jgi:hypothetical protein
LSILLTEISEEFSYFLAHEVRPITSKTIPAMAHSPEITSKLRGISHSAGDEILGIMKPVSRPMVAAILIMKPTLVTDIPHSK